MSCPKTNNTIIIIMKFIITAIAALTIAFGPSLELAAKADKSCWIGSTQVWPQPVTFGLQPRVSNSSGGATAQVNSTSYAFENLLTKVTVSVYGVTTTSYYTNNAFSVGFANDWKGSITLPDALLCNTSNYAQVQVWAFPAGTPVGDTGYTSYAAAKIQGN